MKTYLQPSYQFVYVSTDVVTTSGIPNTDAQEDCYE